MDAPTIESLTTVAGLAVVVNLLMGITKRVWRPNPDELDRFGPLIALLYGAFFAVGATALIGPPEGQTLVEAIAQAFITGLVASSVAIGIYEVGRSITAPPVAIVPPAAPVRDI